MSNGLTVDPDADEMNAGGAAVGVLYIVFHGFIALMFFIFAVGIFLSMF